MPQALLWVQNATLSNAKTCSSWDKRQESRIRSHVQCHRVQHRKSPKTPDDDEADKRQSVAVTEVPAASLRPSKSLGRLALRPANNKRKRAKANTSKAACDSKESPATELTLTPALPFLWHGLSSNERRSLAFFQLRTSQEWSGWEDSHFWNVLALQVSQQSQAVARSLIAVSALHERMEAMDSVERTRLQSLTSEQSSRATTSLLGSSEAPSYFEALVSCLIMICFHGLQHSPASFRLLRSGVKLLAECSEAGHVTPEERQAVDTQLRPLFDRLITKPCGMVGMYKAFSLSVERHRARNMNIVAALPSIPLRFSSLSEARDCLHRILNWAHDSVPLPSEPDSARVTFLDSWHQLRDSWELALTRSDFPKTVESLRSRRLLKAACLVGTIIIETAHCNDETVSDGFTAEFEDIIWLIEGAKSSGHSFGIDAGLLDTVSFVGSKCRDPGIRRRALRLLRTGCRLEGDRIASNPATILEALIALEERGLEVNSCHDIPEQNRRYLVCGQQHAAQARIDLFYASSDGTQNETCCVSLAGSTGKPSKKFDSQPTAPNAIFGTGYAAYLEDRESMSYFRIEMERFYFPIPRV